MRVYSVMPAYQVSSVKRNQRVENKNQFIQNTVSETPSFTAPIHINTVRGGGFVTPPAGLAGITFTGNTDKNIKQVLSLAYENRATGLGEDYQGGMGVVTQEGPASMAKYEGLDIRSVSPFHEHNNPKGGYKFLWTKNIERVNGKLPESIEAKYFLSADPGQTLEEFAKANKYDVKDLRYVIQSEPNGKEANSKSKYCLIEPTSAHGEIERMSNNDIGKTQKIKYALFKISSDNPSYNLLQSKPNYWMYTEELAKTTKPYTYGPNGTGGMDAEINNADFCRAVLKAQQQMNTEEFGYFNPASYWGHDRPVSMATSFIADESARGNKYFDGTIFHYTLHNPRRSYQGTTDNPFAFARAIMSPEDVEALSKHPDYELLQNFNARGWGSLTDVEKRFVTTRFDKFIGRFRDFFGTYNITKIALEAKKANGKNFSIGTVSPAFDKQMKDKNMDVAPGLGADFREIETTSPLNGSTPASLGLDNNTDDFGRGSNTLSARKSGFTPLVYNGNNIEEIIENRQKNAIWLTDILKEAEKEGSEALNKVFFNDMQISQGRSVMGSLSHFQKGDMLVVGWGRPDEQKGFPITLNGILKFLKREDVPKEAKMQLHGLIGWGDLPFDKGSREWKLVEKAFKEIQELDDGAYKHNFMLCDGRISNKLLVGSATHSMFTSRDEICGITPFESKAGGVPYMTTAAGGPKDYTNSKNGWLTKTAPEMNPEFDNLTWDTPHDQLDDARINRSSNEVSDCLKDMVDEYRNDKKSYIARCKKNIEEKYDWHNNDEFNGGKSANKAYTEDIWQMDKGWEKRDKTPMKRLVGAVSAKCEEVKQVAKETVEEIIDKTKKTAETVAEEVKQSAQEAVEEIVDKTKKTAETVAEEAKETLQNPKGSKWQKTAAYVSLGVLALATGGGLYYHRKTQIKKANNEGNNNQLRNVG